MTRTEIILIVLGLAALVAVVLAARSGGPRVTQIDIRRDREKDSDDA
jgi:NAD/NADP transhydrogenase alpha subunit